MLSCCLEANGSYIWIIILENAGTQFSLFFTSNEQSTPMAIKKSKSWGLFWNYQLNSTANSAHLAHFRGELDIINFS